MTKFDQFESLFRSALKDVFEYHLVPVKTVLVVADRKEKEIAPYLDALRGFLGVLGPVSGWSYFQCKPGTSPTELLDAVASEKPGLICTYRNLNSDAWDMPYSLGEHLDILLQKTDMPVMVLPHPLQKAQDHAMKGTLNVMAMTDHMSNNHQLVNQALAFTQPGGTLFLSHIEDLATFTRYMEAIAKIPEIDTEVAEKEIRARLLKDPSDFIDSCAHVLKDHNVPVKVKAMVGFGHRLSEYKKYIEKESVDLLVMSAKDDDQLAMHGLSYPLAIELRGIPLLLL